MFCKQETDSRLTFLCFTCSTPTHCTIDHTHDARNLGILTAPLFVFLLLRLAEGVLELAHKTGDSFSRLILVISAVVVHRVVESPHQSGDLVIVRGSGTSLLVLLTKSAIECP
jgi:hypothetical protein